LKKICVGASSFGKADATALVRLESAGYEVALNPYGRKLKPEEVIDFIQSAAGLLAGLERLDETVFSMAPALRAIARIGVGMDNVDLDAASEYGIRVSNTPDAPGAAVAEMTLTALLGCARRLIPANQALHEGHWEKEIGFSLYGSTVLLIGYGRIARCFEKLLEPFEAHVAIFDPLYSKGAKLGELLQEADIISLHASGNSQILGERELRQVKPGAILLNSARGALVEEQAVCHALRDGRLSWYWADSFVSEPYEGPLAEIPNAILTPHVSTYTSLCRKEMELQAVENLLRDLDQEDDDATLQDGEKYDETAGEGAHNAQSL
jgi:D-3-phosphoglycerate dehydrogenase